jgi:hypothetical protein
MLPINQPYNNTNYYTDDDTSCNWKINRKPLTPHNEVSRQVA